MSVEDNSAWNSIAENPSLATKLRAVVASITRSEGQWPEIGNMDQGGLLISKAGVMKAEKGKTITTLVRGHEVIWGEMDLVRRLFTAGREENIQGKYGYIGKCLLKDPKSQSLIRKCIRGEVWVKIVQMYIGVNVWVMRGSRKSWTHYGSQI